MKYSLFLGLTWAQIAFQPVDSNCKKLSSGAAYYCDNVNDLFQISEIDGLDDHAKIGKSYPVTISGSLQEKVPEGSSLVTKYTLEDESEEVIEQDLCKTLIRRFGIECPKEPQKINKTINITLPAKVKPGTYSFEIAAWTPDGRRIFGIKYTSQVSS
ncbi:Phosphatidylglycerol/phosphatidylinositol transfer protein [Entomophthora muscae]|uniref:Phosphatidylglycerol/phosphatidylinositol transfer protein n=1 Tax=Entomophthora muscae TaxID=34485 RepID=A0ACC2SJG6_9FUNG|nr:Phosphatidylglycerol/phosphatidylinositol transfer protein [Entomophthora muscae]